ncbi:uroplakin-3b [Neoarius graeffei]|uniref:uroplakin-3b n=1 Tax=Neoarius graeffei TaxID=443677 RepID=UPI00298CE7C6|nr:uroplakin-3b [Neoarius graeffei]
MKAYLVVCLVCMIFPEIFAVDVVDIVPGLSSDVVVPVTTDTVYLQKPFCYFDKVNNSNCITNSPCSIRLVAALSSATSTFDEDKQSSGFLFDTPYKDAFGPGGKDYFLTNLGPQSDFPCPAPGTTPSYYLVGADGACSTTNCNGVLPEGSTVRFKHILLSQGTNLVAETRWSDNITLMNVSTVKHPESLGSGYAGRSGAMVVITTILCIAAVLLLLLLLIALILACCYSKGTTQSYDAKRQTSVGGSLRIPSYDVHYLKESAPYDNPAYEQDLKKRYATNSTLPQKTTTVITTMQSEFPDNVTLQKM